MNRHTTRAAGAAAIAAGLALSTLAVGTGPTASAADPAAASSIAPFLAPYYTEGDLTGDSQVTQADLDALSAALGTKVGDSGWEAVAPADLNQDEKIDVLDLAALAQKVIYDDGSFELVEASALDMQKAMNAGVITSVELTQDYLDRIAAYDTTVVNTGEGTARALNSILTKGTTTALAAAAESDALRAQNGGPRSMLDGIPILLKDNYDTLDMPTSAGCACWETNQTDDDAFMVQGLRKDGAVILGKASLDEFATGFTSLFSAGSPYDATISTNAVKYVASPYATSRTAGGSSGGTGAAISANLGGIGFGTDTGGSIRNPSSYNQLVGVRPTVGLASRDGIVPLALSQDTGGPIGRSVTDAAIALDAVVGTDPNDAVTADADSHVPDSYTGYLDPDALKDKHFAYFTSMVPAATATGTSLAGRRIFLDAVAALRAAGATVEEIDPSTLPADPDTTMTVAKILGESSGSTNEFKHDLNGYIAEHLDPDVTLRTLGDIYASKRFAPSYGSQYNNRNNVTQSTYDAWIGTEASPGTHATALKNGGAYLTGLMDSRDWDAVIYPTAMPYGTYASNLRLSPNTGMPAVTVPAGQVTAAESASYAGAGVNLEILGRDYAEGDLLGMAYSFEQATKSRTTPALYGALPGDVVTGPGTDTDDAGDGSVTVSGSASEVAVGDTVTVTVAESADDLYAYGITLGYDASALELVSATSGTTGSTATTNSGGSLTLTHTKLGSSPGAEGATKLGTVTFKALKPGASTVSVSSVTSVDSTGSAVTATAPGSVGVTVPAPPATTPPVTTPEPTVKAKTSTRLKVTPGTVKDGKKVTAHVSVTASTGTPTGTVTVEVAGKKVGTATLKNGKATIRFVVHHGSGSGVTKKKVVVTFDPTGDFKASSAKDTVKVKKKAGRAKKK